MKDDDEGCGEGDEGGGECSVLMMNGQTDRHR